MSIAKFEELTIVVDCVTDDRVRAYIINDNGEVVNIRRWRYWKRDSIGKLYFTICGLTVYLADLMHLNYAQIKELNL